MTNEILSSFLWEQALGERLCGARMQQVSKSRYLTPELRAELDVLIQDEFRHADMFRGCAARYGGREPYPGTWPTTIEEHQRHMRELTPEQLMVTVYVPERYADRILKQLVKIFRQHGDESTATTIKQVCQDEQRHIDVDGRILRHFMVDPVVGPGVRACFKDAIKNGYRQFHWDFLRSR